MQVASKCSDSHQKISFRLDNIATAFLCLFVISINIFASSDSCMKQLSLSCTSQNNLI